MCRYPVDYAANSALLERIRRVFVLRGYLREHRDDIRRPDQRKFVRIGVGQDCIWIFLQITQNLVRLTRNTHIVLRNWTNCTSFHSHFRRPPFHVLPNTRAGKCEMHNFAVIAMENFLRNMRREEVSIDQQINNLLQQQINKNREILKSLFKIRIFCGITT